MAKCKACGTESDKLTNRLGYGICDKCDMYVELATNEVKRLDMMDKITAVGLRILEDIERTVN